MRYTLKTRILAMLLAVLLVVGMPMPAFATEADAESLVTADADDFGAPEIVYTPRTDDYYNVISKTDYILAPGITESEIVLNNDAGSHRQVAHVVEVDIHNPYTKVIPSSKGMAEALDAKKYGVEIMSKQAAYAEANGYGNVVAAMNISLSWYDSAYYTQHPELVGEPLGYLVLDGKLYKNSQGQTVGAQTCLVINFDEKDGVARPADMPKTQIRSTKDAITGWEEQVIPANFGFLVKDGKNQASKNHSSDSASRSFMGIKEDGSIIIVMNDGRQAPYSTGFNYYEMGEFMLSLGCVYAVNGDGGGSSAFLSQRPGEELLVNSAPSDGAERETTHGILVISTAPATGEFNRATISSADDYYTPNSEVQFSAIGTDLVGTAAEIPADATWQLADESFGTIDQNGLFVSNGTQGDVTVQMVYEGAVVGEDTIHIVMPDTIVFGQENMVVPYGKTVKLDMTGTYDSKNVVLKSADVVFVLSDDNLGTINGFEFTGAEEGVAVTSGTVSATVGELTITANLSLGKGSDIVYDFEDQDLTGWSIYTNYGKYGPKGPNGKVTKDDGSYWYHGQNERGYISIVDESTGMVKNGEYALAVECDFSQIYETGFHSLNMFFPKIDTTDALAVGFWIYVPYDARYSDMTINSVLGEDFFADGTAMELSEGWHYLKLNAPASSEGFNDISFSIDERASAKDASGNNYYDNVNTANFDNKYTFYIDDITVDYSSAVDDREAPVFEKPQVLSITGESSSLLAGQTINYNTVTFEARVAEDTTQTNAVGLDANTAKAYVDGKLVDCTFAGGKIAVPGLVLADGVHTIRFEMSDKMGNMSWVAGDINVQASTDASTVKVVPQDPEADRILIGSLYWMDVVATDIETIDKVEMVFDLNNTSSWELEGLTVASGFTADWSIREDDNIASITITRTGKNDAVGEAVLASFPVRTWESTLTQYEGYEDQTPATLVKRGIIWKKSIELDMQLGVITYVEDYESATTGTFGMEDLLVETEIFFTNYTRKSVEGAQEWINAKKAANVGWHEHTAEAVADKPATCTEPGYTGRTYCAVCESVVDWGTIVPMSEHTYTVVEKQLVCECGDVYSGNGLVFVGGLRYYIAGGKLVNGWLLIDDDWFFFSKYNYAGLNGKKTADSHIKFVFDHGRVTKGVWEETSGGKRYWYGPTIYRNTTNDTTASTPFVIDGKTYLFNSVGYMQTGIARYWMANGTELYYDCGDDGVATLLTGIYNDYFYLDGIHQKAYQLVQDLEGNFYFINDSHKIARNVRLYLSERFVAGKTFPDGRAIKVGHYEFGADGKMVIPELKHGVVDGYLYINDVKQVRYQLVEFEGDFYFINDGDKIAKNTRLYLSDRFVSGKTFPDGRAIQVGYYEFGADGKMVIPELKHGVVDGYLYINDVKQVRYQLVEFEGDLYFVNDGDKIVKSGRLYLSERFVSGKTFPDGRAIQVGYYEFDADGKMVIPELKHGVVGDYLYINDVKQVRYKLVEFEGDFYFINDGDKIFKSGKLYLSERFVSGKTFADGTAIPVGYYEFDADGKMIIK